jgi:multidrug efflux pump subunit AcrB
MRRFYQFLLHKNIFVYLISIFALIMGLLAAVTIQREAYPKVDFGTVTIMTVYPGASPEETEKFVTNEIEKNIKDIEAIDDMESVSSEGRSYIALKLFPGEDVDQVISDIDSAINRSTFPDDVEDPIVSKLESDSFPIVVISLTGGKDYAELRKMAKLLDDKLIQLDGIGQITRANYLDQEYQVKVIPHLLRQFYVSIRDVVDTVSKRSLNMPGGKVETGQSEKIVRSLGEVGSIDDVQQLVVRSNDSGKSVLIRDIARVEAGFEDSDKKNRANSVESIDLTLIKKGSADIVSTIADVRQAVDEFLKNNPNQQLKVIYTNDLSTEIDERLSILYSNATTGIIIVFLSLFLFLNFRVALRVAIGIPFSIFLSFIFVKAIGITVNLVSLLGFILVIGMIVDNAIVVGENIFDKFERGDSPEEATIEGTSEVVVPILFSTLTTVAAFMPLMVMGGIMGKFVWSIPVIVILAIMASLIYAMLILPNLMNNTLKTLNRKPRGWIVNAFAKFQRLYERSLLFVLGRRKLVLAFAVILFFATLFLGATKMKFVLFPNEDAIQFQVRFEGPTDMSIEALSAEMTKVEAVLKTLPPNELDHFLTSMGSVLVDGMSMTREGTNVGEITVLLTRKAKRTRLAREILESVREQVKGLELQGVKVTFEVAQNGPPVGKPVKIDILGDNFDELNAAAARVQAMLSTVPGVIDIENSYRLGKPEVRVRINDAQTAAAKLTMSDVANEVRSAMGGTVASELRRGDEEIDVRVIYGDEFRRSEDNLYQLQIPNAQGQLVSIRSIARFSHEKGLADITHFDRKRVVSVTADIDPKKTTSYQVNRDISDDLVTLNKEFQSLRFLQRGEDEDTQESIQNLFVAFGIALFLIFMIIASMFNGFAQPLIIMMAIPFGLIGVILAFLCHGMPISFMMMMGVIGLSGVVVNNTIILVDVIGMFRAKGMDKFESIVEGGKQRLRAVTLTSVTTLLGLFPTAYGIGGADEFIIPLCMALAWGLLFSTVLTLYLLPCSYAVTDDIKAWWGRKFAK